MSNSRFRQLADSYLDHVLIVLRSGDNGANFRDFLDPWWVYERGDPFVRRRREGGFSPHTFDNPCPVAHRERLPLFDWTSDSVRAVIGGTMPPTRLIADHAVPFKTLKRALFTTPALWEREPLRQFLLANFKRAVLTAEENERLNSAGLKARMPNEYDEVGDDPYARYRTAKIVGSPPTTA